MNCTSFMSDVSSFFIIQHIHVYHLHTVDPLKESDKWVDDPPISVEEVVGIEESPMPGYSSYHDYDPLGIAIDEARVGRNKLPVEQVESLYPDGMNCVVIAISTQVISCVAREKLIG